MYATPECEVTSFRCAITERMHSAYTHIMEFIYTQVQLPVPVSFILNKFSNQQILVWSQKYPKLKAWTNRSSVMRLLSVVSDFTDGPTATHICNKKTANMC